MNKTILFIIFAVLVALGIIGSLVLLILRPDASATFVSQVVLLLGLVVSAAGTFYALGKTNEKLEVVQQQTNGNLSKRDDEIAQLRAELRKHDRLADPENFDETTGQTITPRD